MGVAGSYRRHWPKAPASRAATWLGLGSGLGLRLGLGLGLGLGLRLGLTCGLILSSLMVCSVMKS